MNKSQTTIGYSAGRKAVQEVAGAEPRCGRRCARMFSRGDAPEVSPPGHRWPMAHQRHGISKAASFAPATCPVTLRYFLYATSILVALLLPPAPASAQSTLRWKVPDPVQRVDLGPDNHDRRVIFPSTTSGQMPAPVVSFLPTSQAGFT